MLSTLGTSTGNLDIKESLVILLGTIPGERFLHPEYGCDISELAFEVLTVSLKTKIGDIIKTAVILFEPRITMEAVGFELVPKDGLVYVHLRYLIRATNSRTNMVYPFYVKEGTDL
ncbi:MAG: phage baseplate assembly protein W [Arenicella sp.]